jgi:hypothetical protein
MSKAPFVVVWHVPVSIDLGTVATMYNVMASGVLFHKGRRHHVCCNSCVDLSAAATLHNAMIVMASSDYATSFYSH